MAKLAVTPPVVGSDDKGEVFTLNAYSAQYNAAGQIVNYEKIAYPNCTGVPIAFAAWSKQECPAILEEMSALCDFTFHSPRALEAYLFE